MIEFITINGVYYTHCVNDKGEEFYMASRRNCTGYGKTAVEALLDLREKIKVNEKYYYSLLN